MMRSLCARTLRVSACAVALVLVPALDPSVPFFWRLSSAAAEAAPSEKAFEAAKSLGTVDAWEAFLTAYPTGFHADLARAYIKKLGEGAPAPATSPELPRQTTSRRPRALGAALFATGLVRVTASSTAWTKASPSRCSSAVSSLTAFLGSRFPIGAGASATNGAAFSARPEPSGPTFSKLAPQHRKP